MLPEELKELVQKIVHLKTETQTLELKAARVDCPQRLFDTLSSFSNQDEGGILVFGIDEKNDYEIVGVYDPQDLQKKITSQCDQMSPRVRALFTVCEMDGKTLVSAEIPGADITDRPVFYEGKGRLKGSFIRVGDSDEAMTEVEIYAFEAFRKGIRDDYRCVPEASISSFLKEKLAECVATAKRERRNLAENVADDEIRELLGITRENVPTLAGLMTFSRYPQTFFPQLSITAIALPGTEKGDSGLNGARFLDNQRLTGSIPEMLEDAVAFVQKNSRTRTIIDVSGKRTDREEYPLRAVREAILNALVHRDYSVYSENTPISLEMYRDRLEIVNRGGVYGRVRIEQLGKVRPDTRNPVLANLLELMKVTENRFSGIPTIRKELAAAGLPEPEFSEQHGDFRVVFRNTPVPVAEETPFLSSFLDYCTIPRSRKEIVAFFGMSQYYVMSHFVTPLLLAGKLRMTLPDRPKSAQQRYVAVREHF